MEFKVSLTCHHDISKSVIAGDLKLGQLIAIEVYVLLFMCVCLLLQVSLRVSICWGHCVS